MKMAAKSLPVHNTSLEDAIMVRREKFSQEKCLLASTLRGGILLKRVQA